MRTKLSITEGIFPMPVLMVATYNEDGSVNVMNAAWGTMQERETVVLNLTETHKTVKNIKARGALTISAWNPGTGLPTSLPAAALPPAKPKWWTPLLSTSSHFVSNVNLLNIRMSNMAVE